MFDKLGTILRASSLVEMVNSLIRPYLNSCKGQITQETLNLIMFHHNHRRYKRGKRKGKAPIELLSGESLEAPWWALLQQQINAEQDVTGPGTVLSKSPLHLIVNNDDTDQQAPTPEQTMPGSTDATENDCQLKDFEAV